MTGTAAEVAVEGLQNSRYQVNLGESCQQMLPVVQVGAAACELELELAHSQDQKDLMLSQVGGMHVAVANIQVVDMQVEQMPSEDMLAFPLQSDMAWHIPFQIGVFSANLLLFEVLVDITK